VTFTLLPAVDVAYGQAVRPVQSSLGTQVDHGAPLDLPLDLPLDSPLGAALAWQAQGAEWIHLVDLDAALDRGSNADLVAFIVGQLDVKVELSGGISDDASLQRALSTHCERIILATTALHDPAWCEYVIRTHTERIAIALDVRVSTSAEGSSHHRLVARGTTHDTGDLWETLERLDRYGCTRYVVTDVSRDGMLSGPNIELYRAVIDATTALVIASGGISSLDDLVALAKTGAGDANLEGAIVGKALYEGRFTLHEARDRLAENAW
jgi:phosphoribosyl isomerase A